ncbi:AAA family ATPase [Pedobacter sp. BG31]|uniref:AAA family ATPase n=1 Tax=Pedobacter sp. BG31 TaxID=3349697 RepID=UPI0035F2ABA4
MRLEYFHLKGLRRIKEDWIVCGDATFIIGENNIGKSSVLKAMEIFFSETPKLSIEDFFRIDETGHQESEVTMEAKFYSFRMSRNAW